MRTFAGTTDFLLGFTSPEFVDDVNPGEHTDDEHWHACALAENLGLAEETSDEHDQGGTEELPEERSGSNTNSSEDEVELRNLQWNGDQPVDVPQNKWGRSYASFGVVGRCPVLSHVGVVVPCDTRDECSDGHGGLPLVCNAVSLHDEENSRCKHHCSGEPERDANPIRVVARNV